MFRSSKIASLRLASTHVRSKLPSVVETFFSKPGHEVTTFLDNLTEEERNCKIGPDEVNDVLIYYKLIQDTDHKNLTIDLIKQFENKMLDISYSQFKNPLIMNKKFDRLLANKQYIKYLLLLKRIKVHKNATVPMNKLLHHYIEKLDDVDNAMLIFYRTVKDGWSPSDYTYSTLFSAYQNKSREDRILYLRKNALLKQYDSLINHLTETLGRDGKDNLYTFEIKNPAEVSVYAFRFATRNLGFKKSAEMMDVFVNNAQRLVGSKSKYAFINVFYEQYWRSMNEALYDVDHGFRRPTKKLLTQVYEEDKNGIHVDSVEETDDDTFINEETGQIEYLNKQQKESDGLTGEEKSIISFRKEYDMLFKTVLNDEEFFTLSKLLIDSQEQIDPATLWQIITTLKCKMFVTLGDPEIKEEIKNTLYLIFADYLDPKDETIYNELQARKNLILEKNPDFMECRTMKIFYDKLKNADKKYFWTSRTAELFNILLTSSPENYSLYLKMKDYLLSTHFKRINEGSVFVYHKWLSDLSYFNEKSPSLMNVARMEFLQKDFIDLLAYDRDTIVMTLDSFLRSWFTYGYKTGLVSEATTLSQMIELSKIFARQAEKLNYGSNVIDEVMDQYKVAFYSLKKKYHHAYSTSPAHLRRINDK